MIIIMKMIVVMNKILDVTVVVPIKSIIKK